MQTLYVLQSLMCLEATSSGDRSTYLLSLSSTVLYIQLELATMHRVGASKYGRNAQCCSLGKGIPETHIQMRLQNSQENCLHLC